MRQYLDNLRLFLLGFRRFDELRFKPGWSADWRWFALYAIDYGSHVLTGAACVSWSRWFHEHRSDYRLAAFMNRLLRHLDDQHGENSGPALWGTTDCTWRVRLIATASWLLLLGAVWL